MRPFELQFLAPLFWLYFSALPVAAWFHLNRVLKSRPSTSGPWNIIGGKQVCDPMSRKKLFSGPVWLVLWITHMMVDN